MADTKAMADRKDGENIPKQKMTDKILDDITPVRITRHECLAALIEKLSKADRLFNYNLPPAIVSTYKDKDLLKYIHETYRKDAFTIDDPNQIIQYLVTGDRVFKKGDQQYQKVKLAQGSQGTVIDEYPSGYVYGYFDFEDNEDKIATVPKEDIVITGEKRTFRGNIMYPDIPALQFKGGLQRGLKVRYIGKDLYSVDDFIPDKTMGIVLNMNRKRNTNGFDDFSLSIKWAWRPELRQKIENNGGGSWKLFTSYSPKDITLVIPNYIPFEEMLKECFPDNILRTLFGDDTRD